MIQRGHRAGCGCHYCLPRAVVAYVPKWGPDPAQERRRVVQREVERQIQDILKDVEGEWPETKDWHGGLEVTQSTPPGTGGCAHPHTTRYTNRESGVLVERVFCRICGRWWDA